MPFNAPKLNGVSIGFQDEHMQITEDGGEFSNSSELERADILGLCGSVGALDFGER